MKKKLTIIMVSIILISTLAGCARALSPKIGGAANAADEKSGLFLIKQNDKYGYIDKTGKVVIEPQYERASDFSEGLAAIAVEKKWGYIDTTGKTVIEPQFDAAGKFTDDLAPVKVEKKTGYIDKTGKYIWNPSE